MSKSFFHFTMIGILVFSLIPAAHAFSAPMIRIEFEFIASNSASDSNAVHASRHTHSKQFLILNDGAHAQMLIAERLPQYAWVKNYLPEESYSLQPSGYQDVGTSFDVYAKMQGGLIELELTPVISLMAGASRQRIQIAEFTTRVSLPPGQEILLGAGTMQNDFYRNFYQSSDQTKFEVRVKPSVYDI